ncbi:hypothetical protein LZ31DRAFT_548444 [Colletotrichum somersetense]|nr:hypothetical protein LZ31DRAFT_548444 [Colletotrichum somersetense]
MSSSCTVLMLANVCISKKKGNVLRAGSEQTAPEAAVDRLRKSAGATSDPMVDVGGFYNNICWSRRPRGHFYHGCNACLPALCVFAAMARSTLDQASTISALVAGACRKHKSGRA